MKLFKTTTMAKPILIVKIPIEYREIGRYGYESEISKKLNSEYHVLQVWDKVKCVEFQVFYDKDFTEINYEELKSLIEKSLK